ncbi:MAG: hypothetical protein PHU23_19125 [Dehalococcoidales bacterium]|nr:hypothetical protein [Dehalococcoidales bacterium]
MRRSVMNAVGEKEYIDSGSWKCSQSPSGAHHWIIEHNQMTCKHCQNIRQLTNTAFNYIQPQVR